MQHTQNYNYSNRLIINNYIIPTIGNMGIKRKEDYNMVK